MNSTLNSIKTGLLGLVEIIEKAMAESAAAVNNTFGPEVANVYGTSDLTAPAGHEFTGEFSTPMYGQLYLSKYSRAVRIGPAKSSGRRLILRTVAPKATVSFSAVSKYSGPYAETYSKSPVVPAGFVATGAFREPDAHEWYLSKNSQVAMRAPSGGVKGRGPRLILVKQ